VAAVGQLFALAQYGRLEAVFGGHRCIDDYGLVSTVVACYGHCLDG
jgi:hypothetical protein